MFEFLLSIRVSFWLVRVGRMPRRCPATLPPFWEKTSLCSVSFFVFMAVAEWRKGLKRQIHFLAHWSRRSHSTNYPSRLVWAHHQSKMWHRQLLCALCPSLWWHSKSLGPAKLETAWTAPVIGAILFIRSDHSHSSQHIEGVGWQVEVIEAGWHNWVLTAKPIWNCGLARVWVYRHISRFRRSDGGHCDCLPCHSSW